MKGNTLILIQEQIKNYGITYYQNQSIKLHQFLKNLPFYNIKMGNSNTKQSKKGLKSIEGYRSVHIQSLSVKSQPPAEKMDKQTIINQLNKFSGNKEREVYCFMETGMKQRIFNKSNQFFMSFFIPYNNHGDILLEPDNVWMAIMFFVSQYIDDNAEKLRHHFVSHQGKKQLVVIEQYTSVQESIKMEKEWGYFFDQIIKQIEKNTKEGVVDALACNFSTTTKIYQTISTAIIMSSFKQYFDYTRMMTMCGIGNVYFNGTRQDWVKMKTKLQNLCQYDVNNKLKIYVQKMSVILDKFIETYDGNVDKKWWNKIMVLDQDKFMGSGSRPGKYAEGWILDFFGKYRRTHVDDIPNYQISVPIKLINQLAKTQKKLDLRAGWVSVSKVNQTTYKPDLGLCIFLDSTSKLE